MIKGLGQFWSIITLILLFLTGVISFMGYFIPLPLCWLNVIFVGFGFIGFVIHQRVGSYVCKRLLEAIIVVFIISTLTFGLLRLMPGGPFDEEKALLPEVKANIEAKYGLDKPWIEQYITYMSGLLKGDLGYSYKFEGRPVSQIISQAMPNTCRLGLFSLLLAFCIGIPAGVIAASRHNTWVDHVTMATAISGVSLPSFVWAPILIIIFSVQLGWLPPTSIWDSPSYYILPILVLGTRPAAGIARLTRASVLDVIGSDYIRTARAKGLSQRVVLFKHVLKNSLIPVLTYLGPLVAGILSGSFIIEFIFQVPGVGRFLIQSVTNRDYPVILSLTLLFSILLVLSNLIVDLMYSYFDPRIKLS